MKAAKLIEQLARDAAGFAAGQVGCSTVETPVPGLEIWYSRAPAQPEPATFDPRLYVVLQGRKTMNFAAGEFAMAPGMFAVSSIGVPFVTSVETASSDTPYLGIGLTLDPDMIGAIRAELPDRRETGGPSITVGWADASVLHPLGRLLALSSRQEEAAILAPLVIKEIHYRLLTGPAGDTVRQLAGSSRRSAQVRKVAARLRRIDRPPPTIGDLADLAGMSATSLHRHFKIATGYSPIEYGKHLRLVAAKSFLVTGAVSVAEAASRVGYASPSQFSREYKGKFGSPPRDHIP